MSSDIIEIRSCEVCGNTDLKAVLDLGPHPMCDDLIRVGDWRICGEYPIEILFCKQCCTAHQRFQVPKEDLFPHSYHYRSRFTADVLRGMESLVTSCKQRFGSLKDKSVLDIGCNDGSLLDFFRDEGALTMGIEPTGASSDASEKGHVVFNAYLSEEIAKTIVDTHGRPTFVTLTNVFAHIQSLPDVLRALRLLMAHDTVIVIENHYLGAVLAGNQFDTFYHEHPRSYSCTSFVHIARSLGARLLHVEFPARYGGNIRVFLGSNRSDGRSEADTCEIQLRETHFPEGFSTLRSNVETWRGAKRQVLVALVRDRGRLRAKAFPGRAAILIKLLGLDDGLISAVYEKPGSLKIGSYVPGTRIPICSDDELFALPDQTLPLLNLAWHIPQEISAYLTEHGYTGQIVDIMSPQDFPPRT